MIKEAKYLIVLTGVAVVCAALLAVVFQVTKGPIQETKARNIVDGIKEVAPEFDNDPLKDQIEVGQNDPLAPVIYPALKGGVVVGAAVKTTTTRGYAGNIVCMVGLAGSPDGQIKVHRTKVVDMKETPGLGTKAKEPEFADQWNDKPAGAQPFMVKKDGGDINAISGATISSRAFSDCVNMAVKAWREHGAKAAKGGSNG